MAQVADISTTGRVFSFLHCLSHQNVRPIYMGSFGETCPVCPIRNVLKNSFSFQSKWDCY